VAGEAHGGAQEEAAVTTGELVPPSTSKLESGGLEFEQLNELPQIRAIAPEWDGLLAKTQCNRAFSCSKWYIAYCEAYPSVTPHVVVARRCSTLSAVLPLLIIPEEKSLEFVRGFTDYNDVIAAKEDADAVAGLLRHLYRMSRDYRVKLSRLREDSVCLHSLKEIGSDPELPSPRISTDFYSYVSLPPDYNDYLMSRSRVHRKSINRAYRKAAAAGLHLTVLTPQTLPPARLPDLFLSLHLSRVGARSCFAAAAAQNFVGEVLPALFAKGRVQVLGLVKSDRVVAMDLCMVGAGSLCTWSGGFVPEVESISTGTLLMDGGIRHAYHFGFREYDLLRGRYPYKASWATNRRPTSILAFA
jgi:CelD/BcsL family acetyltransferase involved in cellulose biosynthesis